MAKTYRKADADGKWRVTEQDNGVTVRLLEKPSPAYIANLEPGEPEPEYRDPLAEIDQLRKDLEELKGKLR